MFNWKGKRVLITGGAGFIGSSLCEKLVNLGSHVVIFDNFSSGRPENVEKILKDCANRICLLKGDCTRLGDVNEAVSDVDVVYHFAANPEVRLELNDPKNCFKQNIYATHVLLEALRQNCNITKIVFASTSTVYGDAEVFPTPENYGPVKPISVYGASKLASEALVSSYAHLYNFDSLILRFANIIGPKGQHGVIPDLINKLRQNKKVLKILGDGTQCKSYLYINDCLNAIQTACERKTSQVDILNIGSEDWVKVSRIAEIIVEEMGLKDVKFTFTGGINGGRGWKGDVKKMLLDVSKLKSLGWKPKYNSEQAIRLATRSILSEIK